ncbi:MAG: AMP nucleosidase [Opitutaceae bacterium]|nr:AMP nucleosidase [Opitutaceae bacterium]
METKKKIVENWLPRYTGVPLKNFGRYVLLTNFQHYVQLFAQWHRVPVMGKDKPMPSATANGITIINFGMGSATAATVMDLLSAINPKAVLFLGKCGGIKHRAEIGDLILPIAAIRGEGTSNDYFPPEVPALPAFVKKYLRKIRVMAVDMETATIFITAFANETVAGALLLVSDQPMTPEGVKTHASDQKVDAKFVEMHLRIGIDSLKQLINKGVTVKHLKF